MDYGMVTGNLSSMPEVKRLVVQTALNSLFTENFFSICTLDKVMDIIGANDKTEAYKQLRALHCVHYNKMPPELREILPRLVNEALKFETLTVATDQALEGVVF
jgi:hypothetical protein